MRLPSEVRLKTHFSILKMKSYKVFPSQFKDFSLIFDTE